MTMKTQRNAFERFYLASHKRLQKKADSYNLKLAKDENPLLRVFRKDLADLNAGGKMLRGMMVNLGYKISGQTDVKKSDALALAFEIFQSSVLVHDDMIDNAGLRRGKQTIHRRQLQRMQNRGTAMISDTKKATEISKSVAVCVGDLGLYLANKQIVDAYAKDEQLPRLLQSFDEIVIDTIRGELLDVVLPYELQSPVYTAAEATKLLEQSIHDIYYLKTARYSVIGPLTLGMQLGGAAEKEIRAVARFGEELGIAYQIMDDIFGIYGDPAVLGKDVGSDIEEYKQTILYLYVRAYAPQYFDALDVYYGKNSVTKKDVKEVQRIFKESGALDYAQQALANYFSRAEKKLARMDFLAAEDREILEGLIGYLKGRRN